MCVINKSVCNKYSDSIARTNQNRVLMSCDTNGPIRKANSHDDVTENPKRLVPSLMGFVRVRVRTREEIGIFLRAGKKRIFWGFFNK